ncbi:hypothetical protein OH76DRAFT_1487496 [Lentinus brumalis]|uniref:Uncharacterized protein n=1 Tax=Lentinus brumalis TaxID=2498619 RepID=A0A371CUI7_9APHY|nr:hypothetical protein OH76DRAFT_1487496 [Polyporus brumalis]
MAGLFEQAELLLAGIQKDAASLTLVDAERLLSLLRSSVSSAGTIRNSHIPIHQFPDEILALIFGHVPSIKLDAHTDDQNWNWSLVVLDELVPITLVCRRWHDVAISRSRLWTIINVFREFSPKHEVYLRRAGTAPLICRLFLIQDDERSTLDFLGAYHEQIRELQLLVPFVWDGEVSALLRFPMPSLEQVRLQQVMREYGLDRRSVFNRQLLFDGCTPRLRKLAIYNISDFPANRFEQLTDLDLRPSMGQWIEHTAFLAFLSRCPMLQHLAVRYLHFGPTASEVLRQQLPHLRTLIIWHAETVLACHHLLSSILLPLDVSVAVTFPPLRDVAEVTNLHGSTMGLCKGVTRVSVVFDDRDRIVTVVAMGMALAHVQFSLQDVPQGPSDWATVVSWLSPHGYSVTELWLSFRSHFPLVASYSPDTVAAILERFPSVTSLTVHIDDSARCTSPGGNDCWLRTAGLFDIPSRVSHLRLCLSHDIAPSPGLAAMDVIKSRAQKGNRLTSLILDLPSVGLVCSTVTSLRGMADVVEIRQSWGCSWMEAPEVYRDPPHKLWPEWTEVFFWD